MKIQTWNERMSDEETKNLAYWERNMLALLIVTENVANGGKFKGDGWYYDTDNNWEGWRRVISLYNGTVTFHIPDDFDTGSLPQIRPNWDNHTTEQKWRRIMEHCGCSVVNNE